MTIPHSVTFSQFGFLLYLLGVKTEPIWNEDYIKVNIARAKCPCHLLQVPNMISCVDVCMTYTDCEGVNFGTYDKDCELFVKDGEAKFDARKNKIYIDMGILNKMVHRNPCYSRPCGGGTRCIPDRGSYICTKPDICTSVYLIYGKCGVPVSNIIASSGVIPSKFGLEVKSDWCAANQQIGEWIQVRFKAERVVKEVITRGARFKESWIQSFTLEHSLDCEKFKYVSNSKSKVQEFEGNKDNTTYKHNVFKYRIKALCVLIRPLTWHGQICMRFDLVGCKPWN